MRSKRKKRNKRKNRRKKLLFLILVLMGVFFCSFSAYGEDFFYTIKTFLYEDKALEIKISVEKKDNLEEVDLNFVNEGSCDVYLRGFVFVYPSGEGNTGTTLSNSSVKINYGDDDLWFVSEDNYVYYTKPLKVGNRTETPMVESIEVDLSKDDVRKLGENELKIDIVMEAVQMNNFAYKYEWNIGDRGLEDLFEGSEKEVIEEENVIKLIFK